MDEQTAQVITTAGPIVVTMPAEIDYSNAEHIRRRLAAALGANPGGRHRRPDPHHLLRPRSGIKLLIRAHERATALGADLRVVVSPSGHVQRVLTMCGLDRLVTCYPSLGAALAAAPGAAR